MPAHTELDDLFKLPLSEFTAARNALAASLKAAGRTEDAASVKAQTKPPLSAWAVNQLYWHHRESFDQLMEAGEQLRKAQASQLAGKGGEMRAPIEARRNALAELARRAAALLRDSGHPPTPDVTRRITTTLEALATYGNQKDAPPAGRLTADVDPPGFEALSALVPGGTSKRTPSRGPSRVIPFRQLVQAPPAKKLSPDEKRRQGELRKKAERRALETALRQAERALRHARKTVAVREAALRKAAARAKATEGAKAELEKRFEKASAEADEARQEARRVASAAEEAAQSLQDAERQVKSLKEKLERDS